jgi:glutamate/tyrosine decarboxylase-like PLP-dependent enzyme/uncharacterized protein (DUF1810 family)
MPGDLQRFVDAQDSVYDGVLEELRRGRKSGHWMWFIFPQIAGLGRSETARYYAIESIDEARAYLDHPVLGRRLRDCARIVAATHGGSATDIFGGIDATKLRSSMTLFDRAAPEEAGFQEVLDRFFDGRADEATDGLIGQDRRTTVNPVAAAAAGAAAAERALARAHELAVDFLRSLPDRPVGATVSLADVRARFGGPMPDRGEDPVSVVEALAAAAEGGIVASAGPRYFGFVIGGGLPATLAVDWLTGTWDQNAAMYVMSPAAAMAEEVAGEWLVELFGLPTTTSVGFTTGATMATFTGLAAGRHALLSKAGWDVERQGLYGAPELPVILGQDAHATVSAALQMLGLGRDRVVRVPSDGQGRMLATGLADTLGRLDRPALVVAQAGNVHSGAFDPFEPIVAAVRANGGWLHVDGAFGLWAAADPSRRHLLRGVGGADSWTTDAHKWLNVPYDAGLAFVADPAAHRAAMSMGAAYYVQGSDAQRDSFDYVPDSSRRARGFTIWAALRSLGRDGLAELVSSACDHAVRFARGLAAVPGATILNDVVLNQVLVRFDDPSGDPAAGDRRTDAIIAAIREDGTLWLGGTDWRGRRAMRISVSGWSTTDADVDRSIAAIDRIARAI